MFGPSVFEVEDEGGPYPRSKKLFQAPCQCATAPSVGRLGFKQAMTLREGLFRWNDLFGGTIKRKKRVMLTQQHPTKPGDGKKKEAEGRVESAPGMTPHLLVGHTRRCIVR